MKPTREPSRRSLPTEFVTSKLWVPLISRLTLSRLQRCLPEWVRFHGSLLNIKNKLASFSQFHLGLDRVQQRLRTFGSNASGAAGGTGWSGTRALRPSGVYYMHSGGKIGNLTESPGQKGEE